MSRAQRLRRRLILPVIALLAATAGVAVGASRDHGDDQQVVEFRLPSKEQMAKWRYQRAMKAPVVLGIRRRKLEGIAECESHGNPRSIGGGGLYRGKYQFAKSTWKSVGGKGDPARASELEQDRRAAILIKRSGGSPWPNCS